MHRRFVPSAAPVAAGALAALLLAAAPALAATKVGTPSSDTLRASPGGDTLYGGGGSDKLIGGPGNDVIYGVRSGNQIAAGDGDNYVEGGTGDDTITGGKGRNTVYGGSGDDTITLGDGNNYVDPGGAIDVVRLGNGNNVVNAGAGGMTLTAGSGNNIVYYRSGPDSITLGGGVNIVYVGTVGQLAKIDCGGNAKSVLFVNGAADPGLAQILSAQLEGKVVGCPTIQAFDGPTVPVPQVASKTGPFALVGTDGLDRLYGGHGGGTIDGKQGDDVIWADREHGSGGAFARSKTTTITAGNGSNRIYGGRGTNFIIAGDGNNFIRGGDWINSIKTGKGSNTIRLRGRGTNTVVLNGGTAYVESFVLSKRPQIKCVNDAKAVIVYGQQRPVTNCATMIPARSKLGREAQVQGIEHLADSDPVVTVPAKPGENGVGVPRPMVVAK